ncbi:MAG: sigma 54-interacting transcriptional regulator [Archangiaceae bacterium]|nr:sigma 54-interacting transcriptional regulator [Archangiaceae bacterium]
MPQPPGPPSSLADTTRAEPSSAGKAPLAPEVEQALASRAWLMVFQKSSTRMVPLATGAELTIGRQDTCELQLDDERVSRAHARVLVTGNQATLTDLGSQNGTLLNDERVVSARPLSSGDTITIADTVVVFHTSTRPPAPSTPLEPAAFRARAAVEIERARRFSRPMALVVVTFTPSSSSALPALEGVLRPLDLVSVVSTGQLAVVCPETGEDEAQERAERLLEVLEGQQPRVGVAVFPEDGADVETLLASARAAAVAAPTGQFGLGSKAYRTLTFGKQSVLVADADMHRLYELAARLAKSDLAVLIQGETGAGKEMVATALHWGSPRSGQRLLAMNCAALQEALLESELFGHEKGAFTGAVATKQGLFESCDGGTIFLDEVGEMSAALQAKLLRVLETRRVTRLGSTRELDVSFRVVAATHRDLNAEVKAGRFRGDLYFRLAGATLWLPPLRERKRELLLLARLFLDEACGRAGREPPRLAPETQSLLAQHLWPGNVRELRNVMEFIAATVTEASVEPWHLAGRVGAVASPPAAAESAAVSAPPSPGFRPIGEEVRELEQRRMLEALAANGWNQTRAAAAIAMPLRTFVTRFRDYGLARHAPQRQGS